MCGESRKSMRWSSQSLGSPPHVWGILDEPLKDEPVVRITPTCVGNTRSTQRLHSERRDHPHMCGESCLTTLRLSYGLGSPPHVWGKRPMDILSVRFLRITPTYVGKAVISYFNLSPHEDHPHMCGESSASRRRPSRALGSPPHVWGKHNQRNDVHDTYRITPTCVGKAPITAVTTLALVDHPHMCGESLPYFRFAPTLKGSPPHVWGKLKWQLIRKAESRITPTCVGKASYHPAEQPYHKDHPHMCGESRYQVQVSARL